jgi:hypothetical protein
LPLPIGSDLVTAIDSRPVGAMEDIIAYLEEDRRRLYRIVVGRGRACRCPCCATACAA